MPERRKASTLFLQPFLILVLVRREPHHQSSALLSSTYCLLSELGHEC